MELFFFRLAKLNNTQTVYCGDICNRTKESPSVFVLWIEWNVFFDYFSSLSNTVSRSSHVPSAYIDSLPWSLHWWQPACDQLQWSWCVFIYKKSWPLGPCRHAWQVFGVHLQALQLWLIVMFFIIWIKSSYCLYLWQAVKSSERSFSTTSSLMLCTDAVEMGWDLFDLFAYGCCF